MRPALSSGAVGTEEKRAAAAPHQPRAPSSACVRPPLTDRTHDADGGLHGTRIGGGPGVPAYRRRRARRATPLD